MMKLTFACIAATATLGYAQVGQTVPALTASSAGVSPALQVFSYARREARNVFLGASCVCVCVFDT